MFFAEYLIESALSLQQSNSFQVSFFIQRLYSQVNSDTSGMPDSDSDRQILSLEEPSMVHTKEYNKLILHELSFFL